MLTSRRNRLFSLAVLVAAVTALAPASAGAVTAKSADSFVESIGVNVHLGYTDTPYVSSFSTVEQRLGELGVRHVRDGIAPGETAHYQRLHELAARGVRSTLILGSPSQSSSALPEMLAALKTTALSGAVEAVEGWNEPYVNTEATKSKVIENQRLLYEGIKNDAALNSLTVLGPSIIRNENHLLGPISAYLDGGNMHSYPEGEPPEYQIEALLKRTADSSPERPTYATETGYTNATKWSPPNKGENRPVPEEVSATYVPRLFFEYWNRHIVRTFAYELLDEFANPELNEREDHFGLLRNDLSEKPAFVALHNTIAILADPGAATTPGSLSYSIEDKGVAKLHSTLLEKRDGSFYLALWRLQRVWNPETRQAETPAPESLTVNLPGGVSSYAVYEPNKSSTPVSSGGASKALSVGVGAAVTIVKLVPAAPVAPGETPPGETPPGETPPGETPPIETPTGETPPTETAPSGPPTGTTPVAAAPVVTILAPPFMPPVTVPSFATTPRCLVPKLKGRRLANARRALRQAGCDLGTVTRRATEAAPSATAGPPTVVAQRPRAGAAAAAGAKVAVALGPR
jgi:hypothetical protein